EIESIEVLKGPAASALYGTAAANGVIQITTKRGRAGAAQWRFFGQYGQMNDPTKYPANYYNIGTAPNGSLYGASCTIDRATSGLCTMGQLVSFNAMDYYHVQGTGNDRNFGLSTSGGSDVAQYFISGDMTRTQGITQVNQVHAFSLRSNVSAQLKPNVNATVTANYIQRDIRLPYNDNNIYGVMGNTMLGRAFNCAPGNTITQCRGDTISRGFYSAPPSTFYYINNAEDTKRFVGGANVTWQVLPWLTAVGQSGMDVDNTLDASLIPANVVTFINAGLTNGSRYELRAQNLTYSANGSLTAQHNLPWWNVATSTSIGGQYINEQQHGTSASGTNLVPGTGSLATAGANKNIGEYNQTIITVGGYAREQLSWRDRLFVTGSLRGDENSAFGSNFKLAYYPAVSASWVVSEEPFFKNSFLNRSWLSSVRLRSSYGVSGQRPGFRQSDTYLSGVAVAAPGAQELTAVVIGGTGNANLKPEISRELEFGGDFSLFQDRVNFVYTNFRKKTTDALIARTLAPSLGVSTSQFVNLGEVYNGGNEFQVDATAIDRRNLKFDLSFSASTSTNRLNKLGAGIAPIIFNGGTQRHTEGYPLGGYWQQSYTYKDLNGDGMLSRVNCPGQVQVAGGPACEVQLSSSVQFRGGVLPTNEFNVTPTFTLFNSLRLSALFNHRGGMYLYNNTEEFRCTSSAFNNCPEVNDPKAPLDLQAAAIARLEGSSWGYIQDASFTKLREASATWTLPKSVAAKMNSQSVMLTLAGRNLHTWTKYKGFDPELNYVAPNGFTTVDFLTQPPVRMWTLRLDVNF
ncbi:MAG TPA: TonB-dependent receptor, partial [Gemmatimonadaceae bacterium]|nr:TonB-dependent receptor [Gemmatimonadaceae bacterium]